jgi:uncharacterized protein YdeI (YjbR/CyaY-like superfamily)
MISYLWFLSFSKYFDGERNFSFDKIKKGGKKGLVLRGHDGKKRKTREKRIRKVLDGTGKNL